uniref:HU family DNA-binding protein n=1 Tax=uncultured Bacteroides sp. TaxID=162156 RepID=UPI0025D67395
MNERLTIQDLTDLLAAKHSMAKKDAEAFVKEFFLLIEQALESENTVKIKGLGTFKLVDVDSRESVHVNTGERFQIKGHTKVSFSPDASLRDTINKPFAHFETVVLNENTVLEDTPLEEPDEDESVDEPTIVETVFAEEISEQQAEVEEQMIAENIDEKIEQLEEEEIPVVEEKSDFEEKKPEELSEELPEKKAIEEKPAVVTAEMIIEQELLKANLKPVTPIVPPPTEVVETAKPGFKKEDTNKEKSPVPYLIAIIVLVLLLCGGVVLFIYYPDMFSSSPGQN